MPIEPLKARTMPDAAVDVLRRAIFDGSLQPGSQLLEVQLAQQLGISRAPLREALHRLEAEGFVVRVPYRGAFVAGVEPEIADEIARLRLLLEPYAVQLGLADLRSGPVHERLLEAVDALHEAARRGDAGDSIEAHLAVHRLMYEASGNSRLAEIWKGWETHMRLFLAMDHKTFGQLEDVAARHGDLVRVIETGDPTTILRELEVHIHGSIVAPRGDADHAEPD